MELKVDLNSLYLHSLISTLAKAKIFSYFHLNFDFQSRTKEMKDENSSMGI